MGTYLLMFGTALLSNVRLCNFNEWIFPLTKGGLPMAKKEGNEVLGVGVDEMPDFSSFESFEEKTVTIELEAIGTSGLVMDPKTEEIQENIRTRGMKGTSQDSIRLTGGSPKEEAALKVIQQDGKVGIPAEYLRMAMINAGKAQLFKKLLKLATNDGSWVVALANIREEFLPLVDNGDWTVLKKTVPVKGGGSQVNIRPLFSHWGFRMTIEFDENEIPEVIVKEVVKRAGIFNGVGAGRKLGYGRFRIASWKRVEVEV